MTDETRRAKIIEWLDGYMSDCDNDNACNDCLCQDLCLDLDDCTPRVIKEMIERQREEIKQIELRVLESFIRNMPKTYRKRTENWVIVKNILQTGGQTRCVEKCRELEIEPYGYTLERVMENENSNRI